MESLQVLSYNAVLKYGCWHTSHIPDVLKNELRMSNRSIHSLMSGNGYYNYLASESVRFDVAWEDGSWCCRLMGGPLKLIPVVHATIYPNSITYMEDLWCEVFALSSQMQLLVDLIYKIISCQSNLEKFFFMAGSLISLMKILISKQNSTINPPTAPCMSKLLDGKMKKMMCSFILKRVSQKVVICFGLPLFCNVMKKVYSTLPIHSLNRWHRPL